MSHPTQSTSAGGPPDFFVRLGLSVGCSVSDVELAFQQALTSAEAGHDDAKEQLLALQTAYERAKEFAHYRNNRRQWLSDSVERYARQQALEARLKSRGGGVRLANIDWLQREIGEDFSQVEARIEGLSLTGPEFDDEAIEELIVERDLLDQLHWIDLSNSLVTDASVGRLKAFPALNRIDLSGAQVTNAALPALTSLQPLVWVGLKGTRVNRFGRFWLRIDRPNVEVAARRGRAAPGFRAYAILIGAVILLYWASIATATHVPMHQSRMPKWRFLPIDKVFHFCAYLGLAFLLSTMIAAIWSKHERGWNGLKRYSLVLIPAAIYGVLDELTQPAVGRTADPWDWIADMLGATTGLLLFLALRALLKRIAVRLAG